MYASLKRESSTGARSLERTWIMDDCEKAANSLCVDCVAKIVGSPGTAGAHASRSGSGRWDGSGRRRTRPHRSEFSERSRQKVHDLVSA